MVKTLMDKRSLAIAAIVLLGLMLAAPALAVEFRGDEEVIIGPDEVIEDDLYLGAGTITVEGTIKGDLVAAGSDIILNGTVEGDLIAVGGSITINGTVRDDVRIAGTVLSLGQKAQINDHFMAAGYSFESAAGSTIGGALHWFGYQARLAGEIQGDVGGATGALEIAGHIGGDVEVEVGEADPQFEALRPMFASFLPTPMRAPGLTLADGAEIEGKLTYTSGSEAKIGAGAQVEKGIVYQTPTPSPVEERAVEEVVSPARATLDWILSHLRRLVSLLVIGLLLLWIVPRRIREAAAVLQTRPLPGFGWGIVVAVLIFIVLLIVIIAVVILDIILGLLGLGGLVTTITSLGLLADAVILVAFLITVVYISKIVVSFLVGRLLLERLQPAWAAGRVWPLVVGVVLFVIVTMIPILGWVISLICVFLGLGSLWLVGRDLYSQARKATV